jgi:hypothetical protein
VKPEAEYTPWPAGPVAAWLTWDIDWEHLPTVGQLWFVDPDGRNAMIHVERGITHEGRLEASIRQHVWRIDEVGDGLVEVSPSVHFVGHFHTPRPVRFRLVPSRADLER